MSADSPRIQELRRRIQADPASIAFWQLAEEYRRAGNYEEAVECCRAGLIRHPAYPSARVTLGRALTELGMFDEAACEFEQVLRSAPDNLTALRSIAEIHERRGKPELAVTYYKRALALLRNGHDGEEDRRDRMPRTVAHRRDKPSVTLSSDGVFADAPSTGPRTPPMQSAPGPLEPNGSEQLPVAQPQAAPLVDLDAVLGSLGVPDAAPPAAIEVLLTEPPDPDSSEPHASPVPELRVAPATVDRAPGNERSGLEDALRAFDEAWPPIDPAIDASAESASEDPVLQELEAWLQALHPKRSDRTDSAV